MTTLTNDDIFPKDQWEDKGTYCVNIAAQCTKAWLDQRAVRDTASDFGKLLGHSNFADGKPINHASNKISGTKKIFNSTALGHMSRGRKLEPFVREHYERKHNVKATEHGLAVPKWDVTIGGSPDGIVDKPHSVDGYGMIEIKCPKKMSDYIVKYMNDINSGITFPRYYHNHIWRDHYDQMMTCMAIMGKKWCDYIVYCEDEQNVFEYRVYFDQEEWGRMYQTRQEYIRTTFTEEFKKVMDNMSDEDAQNNLEKRMALYFHKYPELRKTFDDDKIDWDKIELCSPTEIMSQDEKSQDVEKKDNRIVKFSKLAIPKTPKPVKKRVLKCKKLDVEM